MRKNKNKNNNYKTTIIGIIIAVLISVTSSYVLAETIVNSKDVYYEDNSGLGFNNVQDAIDGTCTKFNDQITDLREDIKKDILNETYPIGSIYISTSMTTAEQVNTVIGGKWEAYGKGQTLVGVDTSQNEFKTADTTGGAKSVSYTPSGTIGSTGLAINQIPSHTHTISHTHTTAASSITNGKTANTSSVWSAVQPAGNPPSAQAGTNTTTSLPSGWAGAYYSSSGPYQFLVVRYTNNHSHTVTGTIPALSTNSISTTSSGAAGKGTTSDGHTHSFTGTATSISTLQPYVTVYMYKRTA